MSQQKKSTLWLSYIGLFLFLIVNLIFTFYFVNIRDDSTSVLTLLDPFSSKNLLLTMIAVAFVFAAQVILATYFTMNKIRKENKIQFYPDIEEEGTHSQTHWGKYKPEEIREILEKVSKKAGVRVKEAYISIESIPKIFSYNFKGRPVIILNANLLQFCQKRELEAAIGVELGFAKDPLTSYIMYLNFAATYFLGILYAIPFIYLFRAIILTFLDSGGYVFSLQLIITELFFLIGLLIVLPIILRIHQLFLNFSNRNVQFYADNNATNFVGKKNMINMLIKLGQRTEALDILFNEIRFLESLHIGKVYPFDEKRLAEILQLFPQDELSEEEARRLAPNIFINSRLEILRETYGLEIPDLTQSIETASENLREKRKEHLHNLNKQIKEKGINIKSLESNTIDWRSFDSDGNLDLDEQEIKIFIKSLKENKDMLLFENEVLGNLLFLGRVPINLRILSIFNTDYDM